MEVYGYIYKVTNKVNGKCYVGQTVNSFQRRYSGDIAQNTSSQHLKNAIKYYGIENFDIAEEFDTAYSKDELDEKERFYIGKFRCTNRKYGYNSKDGGANGKPNAETRRKLSEAHKGYVMPESQKKRISKSLKGEKSIWHGKAKPKEVREKISASLMGKMVGEKNPNYGKSLSDETKTKLSRALKGRVISEETKRKMSESKKNVKFSESHRRHISEGRKGIVFSEEHKQHLRESRRRYLEARASTA